MASPGASSDATPRDRDGLRVLTFNIWFHPVKLEERTRCIAHIVVKWEPDFVCLQEVTPESHAILAGDPALAERYDMSPFSATSYGCLMMARKALRVAFEEHKLPTEMDRTLLVGTTSAFPGGPMGIATAHFESLSTRAVRQRQISIAERVLRPLGDAVLCGDFNFCSYRNFKEGGTLENAEMQQTLHAYVDCWPALRDAEPGYTFDSDLNDNIIQEERMRYDRVMWRGERMRPARIELVGTRPIEVEMGAEDEAALPANPFETPPPRKKRVYPSDHFGLVCDFAAVVADAPRA